MAGLLAMAAKEAGKEVVVLDLGGSLANTMSGYFDTYDYRTFLYDSVRLAEPGPWHAQLIAAAYAAALDLSVEEEAIIESTLQAVASQGDLASPVSIYDIMGKVEGFRGFYVDKLKGRIGSLRLFDAVDDRVIGSLLHSSALIDFQRAPYPLAAELGAALFLAKLLAVSREEGGRGLLILVTEAHRLFRANPRPSVRQRLMLELLSSGVGLAVSSELPLTLDRQLLDACYIRVHSSESWHSKSATATVLVGSVVIEDLRSRKASVFYPRRLVTKTSEYVSGRASRSADTGLTQTVLEEVGRYPLSTRDSVVQFLAPEFLPADVGSEIDRLEARGCLLLEPKESGSGPKVFAFTLTEKGNGLLEELRK